MATYLSEKFVDQHISSLVSLPPSWKTGDDKEQYYKLDLRMCQLKSLTFNFRWEDDREQKHRKSASIRERPSKILHMNLSLNDLASLEHEGLVPFRCLKALDASLNRIERFIGVQILHQLTFLNLSHNLISTLDGLEGLQNLEELNISMNSLSTINNLPGLNSLQVLHLNNNNLISLDGLQNLPRLRELYAQRNQLIDVLPLSSAIRLVVLNLSENKVSSLRMTVETLKRLVKLQVLNLHDNPLAKDEHYQSALSQGTDINTLDNICIRPIPKPSETHSNNILTIKEAAKQAFLEQIRVKKQHMEENVAFLQQRIHSLQDDYLQYEKKVNAEMDICLRNLDHLSLDEHGNYDPTHLSIGISNPPQKQLEAAGKRKDLPSLDVKFPNHHSSPIAPRQQKITDTDELLRHVHNKLSKMK